MIDGVYSLIFCAKPGIHLSSHCCDFPSKITIKPWNSNFLEFSLTLIQEIDMTVSTLHCNTHSYSYHKDRQLVRGQGHMIQMIWVISNLNSSRQITAKVKSYTDDNTVNTRDQTHLHDIPLFFIPKTFSLTSRNTRSKITVLEIMGLHIAVQHVTGNSHTRVQNILKSSYKYGGVSFAR